MFTYKLNKIKKDKKIQLNRKRIIKTTICFFPLNFTLIRAVCLHKSRSILIIINIFFSFLILLFIFFSKEIQCQSSYESGRSPFLPDTKRGYWANPSDFIYAGLGLAFRLDVFSMSWFFMMESSVIAFVPIYLISLFLYIIPFIVIQSFLGQFSSSGYISAFRLTPLFKGIGYVTLAVNICVLSYYSIFAMVPLVYMFASMQPTLPWECDGFMKWATNLTKEEEINLCNLYIRNETEMNSTDYRFYNHHIPSVLYFKTLFNDINLFSFDDVEFSMSWQLILCAIIVWSIVILFVYKFFNTEMFGVIVRYTVWTLVGLLTVCLIRFSFLPGSGHVYRRVVIPTWRDIVNGLASIPLYGLSAFGPGWGLFISLSSFNKFKTNIMKNSWLIGLGQLGIIIGLDLLANFTEQYFGEATEYNYYSEVEHVWVLYLSTGSAMSHMAWANLWSIIFYFMLFLAAMLLIIIQLYTILTTIFDEFVSLRERKLEVCIGLVAATAAVSLYFTSNHGVTYFTALTADTYITQTAINLLLLLIVLWIYGRVRFQRDIEFMINERFSTWKINILRFVAPLGMLLALALFIQLAFWEHYFSNLIIDLYAVLLIGVPWLVVPGYAIFCMIKTMGTIKTRFLRCCRPTDWYPVEADDRQQYEKTVGNADITHTLNEVKEEEIIGMFLAYYEHTISNGVIAVFAIIFIVVPWLFIPGYAVYTMRQSMGSFRTRFQRCCRPNDWYPVEQEERQRYEEAMGNADITHQLSLAFRFDVFSLSKIYLIDVNVIYFMPECLLGLFIYIVPFIVLQSFLGQFSSSSYISAFRLTPLYKGIGYVALILNICVLSFYSIFAMTALVYMFSSMQSTLPWNCKNYEKWSMNFTKQEKINFGIIIRYTIWILLALLSVLLIRFSFLPGSGKVFYSIIVPSWVNFTHSLISMPIYSIYAFGPGWGLFITLASFNKFQTNIMQKSWFIGLGQLAIVIGLNLLANLIKQYFKEVTGGKYYTEVEHVWIPYLSAGSAMTDMAWANLWSILYYFMLFLSAMLTIIMELYTILTTVFDEFTALRKCKVLIGTCLIAATAFISLYFTSYVGFRNFTAILIDTYFTHTMLNLLLILTLLWIYGRERLQRDIKFMTNSEFSTWQINALRFIVPLGLLIILIYFLFEACVTHYLSNQFIAIFALIFIIIPIVLIPTYAVYYVCQSDVNRPNNWYPVELEDRERYEDVRGYWVNPNDFIYAGLGLAFRLDMFSLPWFYILDKNSIGYITLALNICALSFYANYAVIPLIYIYGSLQPTLPWSCEGYKKWAIENETTICDLPEKNETTDSSSEEYLFRNHHIPSVLYFKSLFNDTNALSNDDVNFSISWQLIVCAISVWTVVIIFFYKFFNTKKFGQIIRYTVWISLVLFLILLIRLSFLPGTDDVFKRDMTLDWDEVIELTVLIPVYGITAFGPGWGIFITLSSFNKFKTNIMKHSWIIAIGQLGIVIGLEVIFHYIQEYFFEQPVYYYPSDEEKIWFLHLATASAISHLDWPNLWSILFYLMLFLSGMLLIIMQLYTILTSIFDEFANLREHRVKVCIGLIAATAVISLYFTSNHGLVHFVTLLTDVYVSQTFINLLLILVVLWVYGRVRFQRDIEFMINKSFSTWKIYVLRFVVSLGILQALYYGVILVSHFHYSTHPLMTVLAVIFIIIPWLLIPVYGFYCMCRKRDGSSKSRLRHSCKPHDWHPVEQEQRQRYKNDFENINNTAIIPTYLLTLAVYTIPLMVIQSFMGQFSSSSYISAFRIAPLFKGIGYITLAINLCVIMYYSIFAVLPLVYMFASMQPTMPWSCEGLKKWAVNLTEEEEINLCNIKFENATDDDSGSDNDTMNEYINHHIPSVLYLKTIFNDQNLFESYDLEFTMSWQLVICSILLWSIVAFVIYKFFDAEKMGQLIRYSVRILICLLVICLIRFRAGAVYRKVIIPPWVNYIHGITMIPIYGLSAFGPGWGLFITLSSFNKFKTNIKKTSWIIGLAQMFIIVAISLLTHLTERYFKEVTDNNYYSRVERILTLYLSSGSVMVDMAWANLWSILFFFMLFLGATLLIIIQLFSTLTTIFDEFATLRERKTDICMMVTGAVGMCSLYFTSNHGVTYFSVIWTDSNITQNAINLLLLLVVLWIYGRIRFQRDIEFMIKDRFSTWQINFLRFVVPLFMLLALLAAIAIASMEHAIAIPGIQFICIIFVLLPWIFIPFYAIRSMYQGIGTLKTRFQHCCRPNDWYPVDAEDRQRYEVAMGNTDATHHLNEVTEEIIKTTNKTMVYESSYDTGLHPYIPDTKRGFWAKPNDFIYAGIALAFRLDFFSMSWFFSIRYRDVAMIPTYLLSLVLYAIPLMVIQSFLGQFSSSSYISSFRLTPLFKSVGYIALAINLIVLTYYSLFAVVPLVYMFASMQPTLPWSCDGFKKWATDLTESEKFNLCNVQFQNASDYDDDSFIFLNHHIPSVLYFKTLFHDRNLFRYNDMDFTMSWQLVLCSVIVWTTVAVLIYKFFNTEKFSTWSRCCLSQSFCTLLEGISIYLSYLYSFNMVPIYGLSAFGPGWGILITLSSFNKFKTNIKKSSWIIALGQMLVIVALSLITQLTERYYQEISDNNYYSRVERVSALYLSSGSVMVHMKWANLWSILYFFMMFLGALVLIVIQLFSILTTIFDEFASLRDRKMEISMIVTATIAFGSLYFTSNHGVTHFNAISVDSNITQNALNLLLILIVLWIYGRIRFQRDIEFMINQRFSTWQINVLRFVSPLFMLFSLLTAVLVAGYEHIIAVPGIQIICITFVALPWIYIPVYAIRSMYQSVGTIKTRFQHCCRPNDWYPVDAEERQRYEETMGNLDVTHQLNEVTEDI
ncbi:Sodium- and chloride-dependent glycine transporter 2 [Lucilia cuprina]|nr:Sodium- and chloride-dependent glycine transporter 2 [Lucilia cuprina]